MTTRALIIDDEKRACTVLEVLIKKFVPEISTVFTCSSPVDALDLIVEFKPTLVFLDIKMPHITGFDLLNRLGSWDFDVIFTTAFEQYAIKAIRFSALDYLLKPVDPQELKDAVQRHVRRRQHVNGDTRTLFRNVIENFSTGSESKYKLALTTSAGTHFFLPGEIIRCESDRNYTWFYFTDHKPLIVSRTLKEFDELLRPYGFIRTHKSHLVNRIHMMKLDSDGSLHLTGKHVVLVSRRKKDRIFDALKNPATVPVPRKI